jgi:hypothetical protein
MPALGAAAEDLDRHLQRGMVRGVVAQRDHRLAL